MQVLLADAAALAGRARERKKRHFPLFAERDGPISESRALVQRDAGKAPARRTNAFVEAKGRRAGLPD